MTTSAMCASRVAVGLGVLAIAVSMATPPAARGATPPAGRFVSVSSERKASCAVRTDATLVCWGKSAYARATPPNGEFVSVSAGYKHACALRTDRTVVCWGDNGGGAATPPAGDFVSVSAGGYFTCAIRTDATLACWGLTTYGRTTPPPGGFVSVSAGVAYGCAVRIEATLACWGGNFFGEATPPPARFVSVSASLSHSCAIRTDATLACWGRDEYGKATPPAGRFVSVSTSLSSSCGLRRDATLACWGDDLNRVASPPAGRFVSVSIAQFYGCAVRTNGRLACWGQGYAQSNRIAPTAAFKLPSPKACVRRRTLTILIRRVPGVRFRRIIVRVRGKRVKTVSRQGFTGPVRLTRLPKGRFKLSITAFAKGKLPVTATRTYRACTNGPKRCGTVAIDHRESGSWQGVVEVAHGGFPCSTAMSVAGTAAAEPFGIGDRLPAPDGWFCMASFRPTATTRPRYVLGCWQGDRLGPPPEGYWIGVRFLES